jgi:hypothetical protein
MRDDIAAEYREEREQEQSERPVTEQPVEVTSESGLLF